MIDYATFVCSDIPVIEHLTSHFFWERKEVFECVRNMRYAFRLYNPDNMTGNHIKIESLGFGKCLKITGSLRKWYLGERVIRDSFEDFTKPEFDDALKQLFSLLEIPDEMRKFFEISSMEVGLTIPVKEMCSVIIRMICGFKSFSYKPTYPEEECKKFSTEHVNYKVYNKALEISTNIDNKSDRERFLSSIGEKNYLRIESKIKGGKCAIENHFKKRFKLSNLEDLITNFDELYDYFWDDIEKNMKVSSLYVQEPIFDPKGKSPGEMMNYFRILGMYYCGEDKTNLIAKQSNSPKDARKAITNERQKATFRKGSYNKDSLLDDIREQLLRLIDREKALKEKEGKIPPKKNKKRLLII